MTATIAVRKGTRVILKNDVDRFPFFKVNAGAKGTVVVGMTCSVGVKLDEPVEGAEEWDNVLWFNSTIEFWNDCEKTS